MQISRPLVIKYVVRVLLTLLVCGIVLSAFWAIFVLYAFSQVGNEDVRFKNHYYVPQFAYGYLIYPSSAGKSATLYTSVDTEKNPLDATQLDCLEGCITGRKPYLSTRKSDCTRAEKKDAKDENCASPDFQLIKRYDGKKQWAYLGKLLYYYPEKKINGGWWQPDIEDISTQNEKNWRPVQYLSFRDGVLVDRAGQMIYEAKDTFVCVTTTCPDLERLEVGHEYLFDTSNLQNQKSKSEEVDKNQWSYQFKPLWIRKSSGTAAQQEISEPPPNMEVVRFQPSYAAKPTQKYLKGSNENTLDENKKYLFNYRGQFLVIPKRNNSPKTECNQECRQYFVPYLVEEDVTQQSTFADFTARPFGQNQLQWFYKNQPVYILVNSYGWPFLEKLEPYQMRLLAP